ncbi:MAG: ABC transporter ATP-binding protein [Alistipes sp.]|uniref:ABC transporter ATP-binding protein n=1 Tax=Alistipes sp. TaxID=1872444 RepID=UPI001B5D5BBF|nr:ABC transporter ATP-binding protein [Alistipes sp.]MBP3356938.1 ABC transporter ATP-binding protein [Rikenellaceae bacterium]MBP3528260.1 ABC transporter ATP-binding protein [Alistipes sp.]
MNTYWRLLGFAKPIGKYAIPYFFCSLLHAVLNTFNFAMIIPILNALFRTSGALPVVTSMPKFSVDTEYFNSMVSYLLYRIFGTDYSATDVMILLAVLIASLSLFNNLFRYLGELTVETMRIRTLQRIRDRVYDNVMGLHVGYFSNERKGDIISKITSDVMMVQFCITNTLHVAFREPLLIIGYMALMITISWELTVFSALFLPVAALLIGSIVKRLRRPAKLGQEKMGEMVSMMDESLGGIKIVKSYNATDYIRAKFRNMNLALSEISLSMARRQRLASPMGEFLGITAAAVLLVFGGRLVMQGKLDSGAFIAYLAAFSQITRPVRAFIEAFATINQGIAAGDRVFGLLDTRSEVTDAPDAIALDEFRSEIEFRDVHFSYGDREVIGGVSFKVRKGETVALVGPSGGGKSTLSDLIPRFYDVTAGEILIDGRNVREYTLESLRECMGIVSQETILFNDTIENNIRLGRLDATDRQIENAARVANAHDFILETENGYRTNIGDRGVKLSGGQRQRLSIARAVLKNPQILILDEATSALDTESEVLVQEALNSLLEGRTSIVIAHRLSTIHNADNIIVIDHGRIAEQGNHAELMALGGIYSKLIEMQQLA